MNDFTNESCEAQLVPGAELFNFNCCDNVGKSYATEARVWEIWKKTGGNAISAAIRSASAIILTSRVEPGQVLDLAM